MIPILISALALVFIWAIVATSIASTKDHTQVYSDYNSELTNGNRELRDENIKLKDEVQRLKEIIERAITELDALREH